MKLYAMFKAMVRLIWMLEIQKKKKKQKISTCMLLLIK